MERGEVWWVDLPEPIGHRPVVLVSRERAIRVRDAIVVAQVTSRIRQIAVEVPLGPEDGMPKPCVVNCDVLHTIPKSDFTKRIMVLSPAKRQALDVALRYSLGLD
jgi:mRNA interferase MazF